MGLISHNAAVTPAEAEHGHRCTYTLDTLERDAVAAGLKSGSSLWNLLQGAGQLPVGSAVADGHHFQGISGWMLQTWAAISGFVLEHLSDVREGGGAMKISFVVAVYHNEGALSKTHEKIKSVFASDLPQHDYEIVFVDDGSKDGSLREILSLREQDSRVKVITFTRNFGQMAAMLAGFNEATGDAVINISADLQDPVELIPQMVEKWQGGSKW